MAKGRHGLEYEVVRGWEQLPDGWSFTEVAGVAVDSQDRVYVFCRGEHPVIEMRARAEDLGDLAFHQLPGFGILHLVADGDLASGLEQARGDRTD